MFNEIGNSLNYYLAVDDEARALLLVFEDSRDDIDWLHDFDFLSTSYQHGNMRIKAHRGFVKVWRSGSETVLREFTDRMAQYPEYEPVIVGWSMGGALAHLAAEELNYRTRTDSQNPGTGVRAVLITYGTPLVLFGKDTRDYMAQCVQAAYSFAHKKDIIAKVPPQGWGYLLIRRIVIGQDDKSKERSHLRYGEKELYRDVHINDGYIVTDESVEEVDGATTGGAEESAD